MTLSPLALESGGLGVGLDRGSGGLVVWVVGHGGRRGSWEGTGGRSALPRGLTGGVPFRVGRPPSLRSLMGLPLSFTVSSIEGLCSTLRSPFGSKFHCKSPKEWERFHGPVACGGPSRSSQLRLAGMGDRLWALRSPSKLNPLREDFMKKPLGNFERWFLPFCCSASVETVMGRVG